MESDKTLKISNSRKIHLEVTLIRAVYMYTYRLSLRVGFPRERELSVGKGPHVPSKELEVLRDRRDPEDVHEGETGPRHRLALGVAEPKRDLALVLGGREVEPHLLLDVDGFPVFVDAALGRDAPHELVAPPALDPHRVLSSGRVNPRRGSLTRVRGGGQAHAEHLRHEAAG